MIIKVKEPRVICYTVCSLPDSLLMFTVRLRTCAGVALGRQRFRAVTAREAPGQKSKWK